ncbi:ATP-binding protein [Geobacter sp.]|uniref:AAA family ATPase n=1 Tax=Geobacter sp. TaxID=46610 RepID=UPI00261DBEAC|nr:ATP-binding protein [Geobacter sp.]
MRHQIAMTKNVSRFIQATRALMDRPMGVEGMGLLWGPPGEGKTTSVAYVADQTDAVYVRALGCWTVTTMLGDICRELGGRRMQRRADMVEWICDQLKDNVRPIFVDEADYLFGQISMIDSLRDIYDKSGCPVVLIGMEDMGRKAQANERLARRITQWVEFSGIDLDDARVTAETCCEVCIADDLLGHIHEAARGNIGRTVIALSRIEKWAKGRIDTVTRAQWSERPLFFDQPTFGKRRNGPGT